MRKIVVTGHLGFIGRHLCRKLVGFGYKFEGIDLSDNRDIRKLEPRDFKGIEYVLHLAAIPKVQQSIDEPILTNEHNMDGTLNVLWCAKEAGVKRVIYSSSSSIYGIQTELPLKEDMKPNPVSPYGIQKIAGEYYCKNFFNLYGLETVSLRYFNVYGEDMPAAGSYSAYIYNLIDCYKSKKVLPIYGGKQTRDFTYVGDVVMANILAMTSPKVGKGESINIGSGENYSIEYIANEVKAHIKYQSQKKGEPKDTLADISKAKELLDWQPETNLIQWLKKTLNT